MSVNLPSYPKDLKTEAAAKSHGLFTIDYSGEGFPKDGVSWRGRMTVQGPLTPSKARMLLEFIEKFKKA